jgi:hypothetical protein
LLVGLWLSGSLVVGLLLIGSVLGCCCGVVVDWIGVGLLLMGLLLGCC